MAKRNDNKLEKRHEVRKRQKMKKRQLRVWTKFLMGMGKKKWKRNKMLTTQMNWYELRDLKKNIC